MADIPFTKMQALGNDFVIMDAISEEIDLTFSIAALANRHTGIGFDQLLLLLPSASANVMCRIFNADGSEAEQCGNGMRAVARYVHAHQSNENSTVTIETRAGIVTAYIGCVPVIPTAKIGDAEPLGAVLAMAPLRADYEHIRVTLTVPEVKPGNVKLQFDDATPPVEVFALSIGNPHAILRIENLHDFPIAHVGKKISTHAKFPAGVNVGFVQVIDEHTIRLATFERGVGSTLSCGSNACAAAIAGIAMGELRSPVSVMVPLGCLSVSWAGEGQRVELAGPAEWVFSGKL